MSQITLKNITKRWGKYYAVDHLDLEIADNSFITLLGPSGCGKTTILRMIAGLEDVTGGELYIGDRLVNDVNPKDRDIAMVFQNYALYPHMTVRENIAFGLKMRKVDKKIIDENMQYYNFKNENDIDLFLSDMKKKYPHTRMYRQLECELLGYGNYNKAMDQAMERDNYTCQITGKKGNVVVHHLNSYNTHKELACDLDNLISLDVDFHKLYHDTCGRGNNTAEQFWKFVEEYKKGLITLDDFKE